MVDLRTLDVAVPRVSPQLAGLRIAHVSDFHFRRWNRVVQAAQDILLALDYDFVVATGDFGTNRGGWARAVDLTCRFFEPIAKKGAVYGVLGNHDSPDLATAADLPLVVLRNRTVIERARGGRVELIGVDQMVPPDGTLPLPLSQDRNGDLAILLAHYPSTVFRLPPRRIDLQLSGHTHGGQIRLPWVGCLWTNDAVPRHMACGLHRVSGTLLHVSRGIGVSPPFPGRIRCRPEVTVLTLQPAVEALQPVSVSQRGDAAGRRPSVAVPAESGKSKYMASSAGFVSA